MFWQGKLRLTILCKTQKSDCHSLSLLANEQWYKALSVVTQSQCLLSWLSVSTGSLCWPGSWCSSSGHPLISVSTRTPQTHSHGSGIYPTIQRKMPNITNNCCQHKGECPRVTRSGLPHLRDVGLLPVHLLLRGQGPGRALRWPGARLSGARTKVDKLASSFLSPKVFHVCDTLTRTPTRISFICPNGTLYSQTKHVCDWWWR